MPDRDPLVPNSPREFRLTDEQRELLLDRLDQALKHPRIDDLPLRLEASVRRLLYQRDAQRYPALTDLNQATWKRLERVRTSLDAVLQIVGKGDPMADTVRYVIACESTGYLRAGSVSEWIADLTVVQWGLEEVLHNTPRRGRGSPGDTARKEFATSVIETLAVYGERLTTGPKGNVASVLTFLPEAAGEGATKDVSYLAEEGMKAAKVRAEARARRRGESLVSRRATPAR